MQDPEVDKRNVGTGTLVPYERLCSNTLVHVLLYSAGAGRWRCMSKALHGYLRCCAMQVRTGLAKDWGSGPDGYARRSPENVCIWIHLRLRGRCWLFHSL